MVTAIPAFFVCKMPILNGAPQNTPVYKMRQMLIAVYLTVPHSTTIDVIPRSHRDRGNLLLGSEMAHRPINIEHFRYSMLIGAILKHSEVLEIAPQAFPSVTTSPPEGRLLAMTSMVVRQKMEH